MSQTHTIVVRFPEGIVPRYSAATEFQGGQVVAVDFDGNRLAIAQELEEVLDKLLHQLSINDDEGLFEHADLVVQARDVLERAGRARQ